MTFGGLLAGLSGCVNEVVRSDLERAVSDVPASEQVTVVEGPERINRYFLSLDDRRFDGLREFYLDSRNPKVNEENVLENRVLLSVGGNHGAFGHGYLINDCGLVLTASHVVRDLNQHGLSNGNIITVSGDVYPIRKTELRDDFLDFAIVSAETGMEPKTHPLKFVDTLYSPCGVDASFTAVDFNSSEGFVYNTHSGSILCVEDMLKELDGDSDVTHKGHFMGMFLRKGFVFLNVNLDYGYSGSPVFSGLDSGEPHFLGLVQGGLGKKNHRYNNYEFLDGFTAVTSSSRILDRVGSYLRENGAFEMVWNVPK